MKKIILFSLIVLLALTAIVTDMTVSYYGDIETSSGNTFAAGTVDLQVDLDCGGNCGFPLQNLAGNPFFSTCDIKPGDGSEVTLSLHINDNNSWGRIKLENIRDFEHGCNEPEARTGDLTCSVPGEGEGELSDYLTFTIWLDEGGSTGWQCPEGEPACSADPKEGDNILNGLETAIVENITANDLANQGWIELAEEMEGDKTHYLGLAWNIPLTSSNVIQTDSLKARIKIEVSQSRNNANPWD